MAGLHASLHALWWSRRHWQCAGAAGCERRLACDGADAGGAKCDRNPEIRGSTEEGGSQYKETYKTKTTSVHRVAAMIEHAVTWDIDS